MMHAKPPVCSPNTRAVLHTIVTGSPFQSFILTVGLILCKMKGEKNMAKKKMCMFIRSVSCLLTLCLLLGGFSSGQLFVSAAELTGYQNESVVRFKNAGSGKYLNVHYGQDSNGINVYQWTEDGTDEQTFKLRYNLDLDCYLIGAMCSSEGDGRVDR